MQRLRVTLAALWSARPSAVLLALAVLSMAAVGLPITAYAQTAPNSSGDNAPWWAGWWWWWWIAIVVLIIIGLWWALALRPRRRVGPPGQGRRMGPEDYEYTLTREQQDALNTLQQRYARGDITREQYNQMRRDILRSP